MLTYCVNRRPPPFELLSRLQSGKTPNKNRNNRPRISLILLDLRTLSLFPKWNLSIFNIPDDFFTLAKTPGGIPPSAHFGTSYRITSQPLLVRGFAPDRPHVFVPAPVLCGERGRLPCQHGFCILDAHSFHDRHDS